MPKRTAPEIAKDVEEIIVVNGPKRAKPARAESVCTMDVIVRNLAGDHVFANAIMWDYAAHGDMKAATLTEAFNDMEIQGNARKESIGNQITRFWNLHSKYIAPTCSGIHDTYTDVLRHVVSLYEKYGDEFMKPTGKTIEHLFELLAILCGPADEAEESVVGHIDFLKDKVKHQGFRSMIDGWLQEYGNIPDSEGAIKDRVNLQIIDGWFFRKEGLLDFCISLITRICDSVASLGGQGSDNFVAYDLQNIASGKYKRFPSCILLSKECHLRPQNDTTLSTDWWGDRRVKALLDNPEINFQTRSDLTAMFVYSGVDAPNGIGYLLDKQARSMTGRDKTDQSYDGIKAEHLTGNFTPWRTANGDWPEASVVEDTNYKAIEGRLEGAVGLEEYRKQSKRYREFKEEPADLPTSPRVKKTKTKVISAEVGEKTNYAMIGGLVAITAGVAAVALSRSRS